MRLGDTIPVSSVDSIVSPTYGVPDWLSAETGLRAPAVP